LDQSGFSPTMPTGYTWARIGERKIVPYEAPEGRRVNVVGALLPFDPTRPSLVFESRSKDEGKYDAEAHLRFVHKLAGLPPVLPEGWRRERPCVIALDNYSVHHSQLVKDKMPALEAAGVSFFFLPPYSPEMNAIEPLWRQIKYQDLPERSYKTAQALKAAVDEALTQRANRFKGATTTRETNDSLRRCA
jgi:transposase